MTTETKTCKTCSQEKLVTEFRTQKVPYGYHTRCVCKECEHERQKKYYAQHPERRYKPTKERQRANSANSRASISGRAGQLIQSAKLRAKKHNLFFDINKSWLLPILEIGICQRTGMKLDLKSHKKYTRNPLSPSLDRIDNSKGYTKENTQVVCSWYNVAKNEYTDEFMLQMCKNTIKYEESE